MELFVIYVFISLFFLQYYVYEIHARHCIHGCRLIVHSDFCIIYSSVVYTTLIYHVLSHQLLMDMWIFYSCYSCWLL